MLSIIPILVFFIQFGALYFVWRFTTYHNARDFVFFVIGMILAAQNCEFFGSAIMVQLRHFFFVMILVAIYFRLPMLRGNLGALSWLYIVLVVLIYIASAWSQCPENFFLLKLRRTVYAILIVIMAGTFNSEDDIRKILWAIFPNIILLVIGFRCGVTEGMDIGERLTINEVNSNKVGYFAAYVVVSAILILIYLRGKLVVKVMVGCAALSGMSVLLNSGSRTAFVSCVGASIIAVIVLLTNRRRFFSLAVPIILGIIYGGYHVWNTVSHSVTDRFTMIMYGSMSGRELVWEDVLSYLRANDLWYGLGGIVRGAFVQRIDLLEDTAVNWGSMLNIYFDAIAETGVLGLTLWVLILWHILFKSFALLKNKVAFCKYVPVAMCLFGLLEGVGESVSLNAETPAGMFMVIGMVILSARRFQWGDHKPVRILCEVQDMFDYNYKRCSKFPKEI